MRATCEHCGSAQPRDWTAGDICIHCGKSSRSEICCYWCVAWIPAGSFCRSCGAAAVDRRLFGPARMLKDGGVDRFSLPKMLSAMDADQVENLDRIYQRQAAILARHVDDVVFLQQFLFSKHWSAAVEDALLPQLPWNPQTLAAYERGWPSSGDALDRARAIEEHSPVALTRSLALLARLRLDDFKAYNNVLSLCDVPDAALRTEAALAVTGWRVLYAHPQESRLPGYIKDTLREAPFPIAAAIRLALLGDKVEIPRDAINSRDEEAAIGAALALGDTDRLAAALQSDRIAQIAAGTRLARLGCLGPLASVLRSPDNEVRQAVLSSAVLTKHGAPQLQDPLLDILENESHWHVRRLASQLLCRTASDTIALRILRAANGESTIVHNLLLAPNLTPDGIEDVCLELIESGRFRMSQFGLSSAAEKGRIPDDFVIRRFRNAPDDETREELCRFAETQLIARGDDKLHRFVLHILYGDYSAKVRHAAFWAMRRWHLRTDPRGEIAASLHIESAERFFGSVDAMARRLAVLIRDPETREDLWEEFQRLLRYADPEALAAAGDGAWNLADAVVETMHDSQARFTLRTAGADYLGAMRKHAPWRNKVDRILRQFQHTDLDHACTQVLERTC